MEAAALAECERLSAMDGNVSAEDVASLIAACAPTLGIPGPAEAFFASIKDICSGNRANKAMCGAAGVIPLVAATLASLGPANPAVAAKGCTTLSDMSAGNTANADEVVMASGGLDAICAVMGVRAVQQWPSCTRTRLAFLR